MKLDGELPVRLIEGEAEGSVWKVSLLEEGPSKNTWKGAQRYYSKELLEEIYPRFDGIPAYVYRAGESSFDHLPGELQQRDGDLILNKIGWYEDPRIEEIDGKTNVVADLHIHEGAESVRKFFREAWDRGKRLGVSIVADGYAQLKKIQEGWYAVLEDLVPRSVDPVTNPATGARFLKLIETEVDNMDLTEGLIKLTEGLSPDLLEEHGIVEYGEGVELEKESQLDLVDGLIAGLEPETFPEELLGNQLRRLREAVFTEEEDKAEAVLGEVFGRKAADGPAGEDVAEDTEQAVTEAVEKLDGVLDKIEDAVAVDEEPEENPESKDGAVSLAEIKRLLREGELEEALALLDELMPEDTDEEDKAAEEEDEAGDEKFSELEEKVNSLERTRAEESFEEKIRDYGLPTPAERRLRRQLFESDEYERVTEEDVAETIERESEFVNDLIGEVGSQVTGMEMERLESGEISVKESEQALDDFFARKLRIEGRDK
ncbi:MAG: hypothetical protein ACLFVS_03125 [Candidatus Acetothermia bacterium]